MGSDFCHENKIIMYCFLGGQHHKGQFSANISIRTIQSSPRSWGVRGWGPSPWFQFHLKIHGSWPNQKYSYRRSLINNLTNAVFLVFHLHASPNCARFLSRYDTFRNSVFFWLCFRARRRSATKRRRSATKKMKGFDEHGFFLLFLVVRPSFPCSIKQLNPSKNLKLINGIPDPTPFQSSIFKRYWIYNPIQCQCQQQKNYHLETSILLPTIKHTFPPPPPPATTTTTYPPFLLNSQQLSFFWFSICGAPKLSTCFGAGALGVCVGTALRKQLPKAAVANRRLTRFMRAMVVETLKKTPRFFCRKISGTLSPQ